MELEYKWDLASAEGSRLALDVAEMLSPHVRGVTTIHMHATYYDTPEGLVRQAHGGLRMRCENEKSVCCLKLAETGNTGYKVRREHEVEADDIRSGIALLPQEGAPAELCAHLLEAELEVLCETEFDRRAFMLYVAQDEGGDAVFSAELAFDEGVFRREGREQAFREMELEHKGGSLEAFHAFARTVQETLGLQAQSASKLARAMVV